MHQDQIKSPAFQNAELRSERLRILAVLGFVAIFIVVTVVRVFVIRTAPGSTPWVWSFLLAAIVISYELWMLRRVDLTLKAKGSLPDRFWILSTIVETAIPAFAMAFLTSTHLEVAYRPLVSPAVLVFFIFIILSTLRLDPGIGILSGTVASVTYTGGDYFDWKTLPDGRLVVSLADVTGHGIGPALLAAVCHAYARTSFSVTQDLPAALEHIHQALTSDLTPGRFVTFVAAVCCPGCPDIEILSAGHGPLFIYSREEDRFTEVNAHALPLGIVPAFSSDPPSYLPLNAGDIVLLATDGFFEWENDQG